MKGVYSIRMPLESSLLYCPWTSLYTLHMGIYFFLTIFTFAHSKRKNIKSCKRQIPHNRNRTIRITYYFLIETLKKTEGLEKMYYRLIRDYRFQLRLL